jgi:hypothetical protein
MARLRLVGGKRLPIDQARPFFAEGTVVVEDGVTVDVVARSVAHGDTIDSPVDFCRGGRPAGERSVVTHAIYVTRDDAEKRFARPLRRDVLRHSFRRRRNWVRPR